MWRIAAFQLCLIFGQCPGYLVAEPLVFHGALRVRAADLHHAAAGTGNVEALLERVPLFTDADKK